LAEANVSSDTDTLVKSVSKTPDFKLSTSKLLIVLLSAFIVLLVNVCVPVSVTTVESIAITPPVIVIPVPWLNEALALAVVKYKLVAPSETVSVSPCVYVKTPVVEL